MSRCSAGSRGELSTDSIRPPSRRLGRRHLSRADVSKPAHFAETRVRDRRRNHGLAYRVPIRMTSRLTVAPEFRVTLGLITDESTYKVAHTGVRVMWGF